MMDDMLKWIGGGFVGISLFQYGSLIRPQKQVSNNKPRTKYEKITFVTEDGVEIAGWWIPGEGDATIIVGHGYPFDKGNIYGATRWLHPEFNLLYYDHRSFGESQGSMTTGGIKEVKDVEAAIRFARSKSKGSIGLFGFSFSGAAMLMSKHDGVKAIVSDSSYATIDNVLNHLFSNLGILRWPFVKAGHLYAKFLGINLSQSPLKSIENISIPLLLIHGDADTQISLNNARQLYAASNPGNTELLIIPGADHGQTLINRQTIRIVKKFFRKNLN